ncbi:MAG TPA: hypothetical protein VMD53_19095 [Rhizomicrobium sp.]|nr:hypothetical protein [Rhizomicrobium sp.]
MQTMLALATAVALIGGGAMAIDAAHYRLPVTPIGYTDEADRPAGRIVIGIDLSKSNPLIENPQFAAKVGARIAGIISKLGFASEVHVRTFGTFDATANPFYYDTMISARSRPEAVASDVERLIAGTPVLVAGGRWKAQGRTNILAFLDNVSRSEGCGGLPTTVILASDGIEDSQFARLDDPNDHLPDPDGKPFAGCVDLQILGLGEGTRSPIKTARLRAEWTRWARAAGFSRFEGLNDW